MATNNSRQPYTIKMWGTHLKSADTQAKLRKYDQLRNDPVKSGQIYDRTVHFGMPIPLSRAEIDKAEDHTYKLRSSNDRRFLLDNMTWSQFKKAKDYHKVFGNALNNKYDYIPYVDILKLPTKDRPHTFAECIDFFYPMSGVTSHLPTQYPFTTTYPQAYNYNHAYSAGEYKHHRGANFLDNKMPVDLGEITMMYIWYVMYRMLLTNDGAFITKPDTFLNLSEDKNYKDRSLLSPKNLDEVNEKVENLQRQLAIASKLVDAGGKLAKAHANGEFDSSENLNDVLAKTRVILDAEIKSATTAIGNFVKGEVAELLLKAGISEAASRQITGLVVGTAMNPKTYEALTTTDQSNVLEFAKSRIAQEFKNFGSLNDIDKNNLAKAFATKNFSNISLTSQQARNVLNQIKSKDADNYRKIYTETMKQLKARRNGIRENGVVASLLVAGAVEGIKYGINSVAEKARKRATSFTNWLTTNKIKVDPKLTEEGFELAFDDFITSGDEASSEHWFGGVKMYCSPRNGLQMAEFANALYRVFAPSAAYLRVHPEVSVKDYLSNRRLISSVLKGNGNIQFNYMSGKLDTAQFKDWFTDYQDCQTFKIFLESAYLSTALVFKDIESFSPFTQAYGLEPIFIQGNEASFKSGKPTTKLAIIGDPKAGGKEYTTPADDWFIVPGQDHWGAKYNNADRHYKATTQHRSKPCVNNIYYRASTQSPDWKECISHKKTGSNEQGWTTPEVETYYANLHARKNRGVIPVGAARIRNSQRRLSDEVPFGYYGSTSIGFDVAYGVPILNAQWPALLTVLSIYPKALENMSGAKGYAWATSAYLAYTQNRQADLRESLARLSNIALPQGSVVSPALMNIIKMRQAQDIANTAMNVASKELTPKGLVPFLEKSQATAEEEKSQATAEETESNTGLYVALGLGITAIAGASYYVIQKKKGKL